MAHTYLHALVTTSYKNIYIYNSIVDASIVRNTVLMTAHIYMLRWLIVL